MITRMQQTVSISRLPKKKGASRSAAHYADFLEIITPAKILLLVSLFVLFFVFYGVFVTVGSVMNVPVSQVNIEGEFRYITEAEINDAITQYVVNDFVSVDLKELRKELLALPWVYKASVKRQLPNGLLVTLIEQQPIAYWNKNGMLNEDHEIFFPSKLPKIDNLPKLEGKNHKAVFSLYEELNAQLPKIQLPINDIKVNDRNVAYIKNGLGAKLIFNAAEYAEKIKVWKTLSASSLGLRLSEVDYVDLRYSNGAAVKWLETVDVQSKQKIGGV
jgi:cell division protein FtsQ